MTIEKWSDSIVVADLQDEPAFTDDLIALNEEFNAKPDVDLVLNFGAVHHLNSGNIAKLLKLRKQVTSAKRRLVIAAVRTNVWGVFLTTGLDKIFDFADSVATALASVQLGETE
jgi:anti-anti-sigma factor